MKTRKSSPRPPRRKTPADVVAMQADNGQGAARKRKGRAFDGRTREAKRWTALHEHYVALAGKQHDQLARALASLIVQREALDRASARGEPIDPLLLCRLSGEIRRLLSRLGLDEPAPDPLPHDAPSWMLGPRAPAPEGAA
jgi:hypothetical protein